ncbi:hypothetical protein FD25_GL002446 [Levilactobacillus acidifarinae DSM 19394]|uniref:HTH tetR-type domain-containing protein n=2 Tax=Levilactobacillus acidifarinae TaxID=267364 RepID=A0A0R1LSX3_9LACO|nr:TetR/AcrR family transcriptional regulator [Levilactobacillus acidifarinae]KRK95985.1 hypothetical protein FD25_GL002446 [Levilactobacillus acidifarinae DSM 19394]GEO69289.1 hypothetical protein LAC03_11990 [Levilactobacillus acidifarinae]
MTQRNVTKTKIIQAAMEIGTNTGLHDLSMPQIAKVLGVRSQSLYNHVSNLDDVLTGISLQLTADSRQTILTGLVGKTGVDAVLTFFHLTRTFWLTHLNLAPLLFNRASTATNPDLLASRQQTVAILDTLLRDLVRPDSLTLCSKTLRSAVTGFCLEEVKQTDTQADQQFDQMVLVILKAFTAPDTTPS